MSSLINLNEVQIGRDFNIYLEGMDFDGLQRINDYFLNHGMATKIYAEVIECFTSSEGYFSEKITIVTREIDQFLAREMERTSGTLSICTKLDDVEVLLAKIKFNYNKDHKKLAYINYLQGCLMQIQFKFIKAYCFFKEACDLDLSEKYYVASGELSMKLGKFDEAEFYFSCSLNLLEETGSVNCIKYVESLNNFGGALDQQYRYTEAIYCYHTAEKKLNLMDDTYESMAYLGLICNNLGGAYLALEDYSQAEKYLLKALDIRDKYGATANEVAITKNNIAEVYRARNDIKKAEDCLKEAYGSLKDVYKKYAELHPTLALTLNNLANLYLGEKKYYDAVTYFKRALGIWENVFKGSHNRESVITLYNLAISYWYYRCHVDALNYFQEAKRVASILLERGDLKEEDRLFVEIEKDFSGFTSQIKYRNPILRFFYFQPKKVIG